MKTHSHMFKVRLGLFILGGIALLVFTIFIIGKQKNLFNPVFKVSAYFYNVSGLDVGNNIRFLGINVGTVSGIRIVNDSTVKVDLFIRKEIKKFIKSDCIVAIGSEGLIGDRLILILPGTDDSPLAQEGEVLVSVEPVETDDIIASLQITAGNAEVISQELAEIMIKVNNGEGALGSLIGDSAVALDLGKTMDNLRKSSRGLNENMEAAKSNFLLRGFFNKKAREAKRKEKEAKKALEKKWPL